ncbi:MAG: hypothetical protein HKO99_11610 [Xanthomonadales bacterium]|nr:hypothetical protein [Gammaproteobacteria bacterium]MBT8054744.1 hypothetical protein [Gammaproteobacteria bacterium]NNK52231.1 hypothetical protein [Xanthomonadales bacterium]
MILRVSSILIFTLGLLMASAATAKDAPPVNSLMTPEDYTASGLEKLSDAERAHLSEWLERYRQGAVIGPVVKKAPSEMNEQEKVQAEKEKQEKDKEIMAKVIPAFRGWSGKTVFRLDNGQTWQQRQAGRLRYSDGDSRVVIRRNIIGKYIMKHEDSGRAIGVERID